MRLLLALLILLIPAFAEANTLQLKLSQAEAEREPAIVDLKNKYQKAAAEELMLKDKRQDLVERNTAMAADYAKISRGSASNPADIQKAMVEFQKKSSDLNAELTDVSGKLPEAEKETARLAQELKLATWETRIADKEYGVYVTDGSMEWKENPETKKLEKRILLLDRAGKKYFLDTPQDLKKAKIPGCGVWLKDEEVFAVWLASPQEVPKDEKTLPTIKASSLGQVYFLERAALPKECPFGQIAEKEAAK